MRSVSSRWRSLWSACGPLASALAVVLLVAMVASNECNRHQVAAWDRGFEAGVQAALEGGSVRWGICLAGGREFKCAKTSEGALIEVRIP